MQKNGFTLAEVLITLGIVGVVSALVLPTFTTKMQTAKVGPRLAKAVASFEQANIAILNDEQADELSATDYLDSPEVYFRDGLPTHMKGSYDSENNQFISADGVAYCIVGVQRNETNPNADYKCNTQFFGYGSPSGTIPHLTPLTSQNGRRYTAFMVDIDANNGPNSAGRDRFFFQMMDDGSLRPWGGSWDNNEEYRWQKACPKSANGSVKYPYCCAGHVMENGLKVEYKASGSGQGRLPNNNTINIPNNNNPTLSNKTKSVSGLASKTKN